MDPVPFDADQDSQNTPGIRSTSSNRRGAFVPGEKARRPDAVTGSTRDSMNRRQAMLFGGCALLTAVVPIFSAVLMTEPGQALDLPRAWTLSHYAHRWLWAGLSLGLLILLWGANERWRAWPRGWMWLASSGVLLCLFLANGLLSVLFPSQQHGASYVSVDVAGRSLAADETIYAVEINGEVKGFPRSHLEIPHVAGATIGGQDVVMTFCALSNLPVVYSQDIGHGPSDLEVLIQTHNNLTLVDRVSGDVIQQITGASEFLEETRVTRHPNRMMSWDSFRELHPDAEVFRYRFDSPFDAIVAKAFEAPLERQFSEEFGPIFPTLAMQDTRLPHKEQVWGVDLGGHRAAFTLAFLERHPSYAFELGGRRLLVRRDSQHGFVELFELDDDSSAGAPSGGGRRLPLHNGVFWMVWSHWFPDTEVFSLASAQ